MNEKKLSTEQRVEALEAKVSIVATGLNAILTEFARIEEAKNVEKETPWDPSKIKWIEAQGEKGPYERSEHINNRDFKAMVKDLADHNGKLNRAGYFYWLFQSGSTVGRKKRRH